MNPLKQIALADLEQELATTRRVLDRVPDEHLGWRPHAKSKTLGELAAHIANLAGLLIAVTQTEELDISTARPPQESVGSREELLAVYDRNATALRAAVDGLGEVELARPWTFRFGERVVFTAPKAGALRSFGLMHTAHHRGQLTVYLRMLDVPLPAVYGPTADEGR